MFRHVCCVSSWAFLQISSISVRNSCTCWYLISIVTTSIRIANFQLASVNYNCPTFSKYIPGSLLNRFISYGRMGSPSVFHEKNIATSILQDNEDSCYRLSLLSLLFILIDSAYSIPLLVVDVFSVVLVRLSAVLLAILLSRPFSPPPFFKFF